MSHMLHSYTFVLTASCWDILTLISPSHTCTQTLSPRFNKRCTFLKDVFKTFHLQTVLQPIFVLTVNCAKLMNSSATSLCQHCSNQALTWHQQNCLSAFLSNGCHSTADRGTWAKKWWEDFRRRGEELKSALRLTRFWLNFMLPNN